MKLQFNKYCHESSLKVDDVDFNSLDSFKQSDILIQLVEGLSSIYSPHNIIKELLETYGETKYSTEPCDQCGSTSYEINLEI